MPSQTVHAEPLPLAPSMHERIWGTKRLSPWFPDSDRDIGEVWFQAEPPLPVLVKFIFTAAALSVQVHPPDDYAQKHEKSNGKTEMWHILRAAPGARIALGLKQALTAAKLRAAASSGEIETLLNYIPVRAGDTFHIPAGTIHAIGGGIALCEIQQQSDVTYRLYDYGRPRELHLDRALDVSDLGAYAANSPSPGHLARCRYYATQNLDLDAPLTYVPDSDRFHLLIILSGEGRLGDRRFQAGQVWHVPAGAGAFHIQPDQRASILRTYIP